MPVYHLAETWQSPPVAGADPVLRTTQYFRVLRELAVQADWVALAETGPSPLAALTWIGHHIHIINGQLGDILTDLLSCFEPGQHPSVQILAAPIAPKARVDGFCNLQVQPITLVVDPSRVVPTDWQNLVAHELAHGVARTAGHGLGFRQALTHLCLAQDLPLPPTVDTDDEVLKYWPPYQSNPGAEQFWIGRGTLA
ncbi:MAG: hypothetical protein ACFCVD_05835 [Nodosilinea sp.]